MTSTTDLLRLRWCRILLIVSIAVGVFAVGMILPPRPGVAFFNLAIYGSAAHPADAASEANRYLDFIYGVLAAVLIGWVTLIGWLTMTLGRSGVRAGADAIVASVIVWFTVDSTMSLLLGYWQNAAINVAFLGALLIPALKIRQYCAPSR